MTLTSDQQARADKALLQIARKNAARQIVNPARETPLRSACEAVLDTDPKKRGWLRAVAAVFARSPQALWGEPEKAIMRSLTSGDSGLGQAVSVIEGLADDVYVLLHRYSAFRTFGVVPLDAGKKKLASVTGKANAGWITAANQGTPLQADAGITGTSVSAEVATVGTLITVSGELLGDGRTTFEGALLQAIIEGLGYRLDFTCLQADGTDDDADGGQTGIFAHADIPVVTAADGNVNVAVLDPDDFASLLAAVDSSAFAHPCRFWIHPDFLPPLLKVRSGSDDGSEALLKPPSGPDDEWRIFGQPVTWAAAGPNTDAPGEKVAAFGRCDAYTVALRKDFEITSSVNAAGWASNAYLFRALARARCLVRDASSLAVLKLAAS